MTPLQEATQIFNFYYLGPQVTIEGAKNNSLFLVNKVLGVIKFSGISTDHWDEVKMLIEKAETLILNYPEESQY